MTLKAIQDQPTKLLKLLKALCHQGNPKFGNCAGMQCALCALVSVCWSCIKQTGYWNTSDIDRILEHGSKIFNLLGFYRPLSADELPRIVSIGDIDFRLTSTASFAIEIKQKGSFLSPLFKLDVRSHNGLLLFLDQLTVSLIWTKSSYFFFDPIALMVKDF